MQNKIIQLKNIVIEKSKDPSFLHHNWFVDYHLNIVERIAFELCDIYKEADKDIVEVLVWIHDYGKILNMEKQHELNSESIKLLTDLDFESEFIKKVSEYLDLFERKMEIDLNTAPIEVRIVSSADAASHSVGPFMSIHWKEFSNKSIPELMESNRNKINKDWNRKIVLPEVREAFKDRFDFLLESSGDFPDKFLK